MGIRHKYNAKAVVKDNIRFDSQKEGRYYDTLKLRQQAGEVVFFLRQVPLHLEGNVKMVVDFVEFWSDGTVHFVDVKGMRTPIYILKKKQVEARYPFKIEEV